MDGVLDTSLPARWRGTPSFEPRRGGRSPSILVMHYTGMETAQAALDILCSAHSKVSCHYLVDEKGDITQMVREDARAWHAGRAYWAGEHDVNSSSIGIEIVNEGHVLEMKDFPDPQIESVIDLAKDILSRHSIPARSIIGHSDIAPDRKKDPGERFPWGRLYESGIGHWVEPVALSDDPGFGIGEAHDRIALAQEMLAHYGYQVPVDGHFDEATDLVVRAFQRHFRPQKIDGRLDRSTYATLENLIDTMPQTPTS